MKDWKNWLKFGAAVYLTVTVVFTFVLAEALDTSNAGFTDYVRVFGNMLLWPIYIGDLLIQKIF